MKKARDLYPGLAAAADKGEHLYPGDYDPIIDALGVALVREDDNNYQGDTFVLLKAEDGRLGFVRIGWGSCSGCDALQACRTLDEIDQLAEGIEESVRWFKHALEARDWFEQHDWAGEYSYRDDAGKVFLRRAWEFLGCSGEPRTR